MDVLIAGESVGQLKLGVYRDAAPDSCDTFSQLARGTLVSDPDDVPATLERSTAVRVSSVKRNCSRTPHRGTGAAQRGTSVVYSKLVSA